MTEPDPGPPPFTDVVLPEAHDEVAPDGSLVRVLAGLPAGSMAHFELAAGEVSVAHVHRTVSEIWYVLGGRGAMWRSGNGVAGELDLAAGVSLTIPVGTRFQFRSHGDPEGHGGEPLTVVAVTMPPWPGDGEATEVDGPWPATVVPPD